MQHLVLDSENSGADVQGIRVRPKPGLAGCEYLSEQIGVKAGTVILGVICDMLRQHGYSEWDGQSGSMIGASYDWRLMPFQLEKRDRLFGKLLKQLEQMVAADPQQRAAVVVGFSLGCRIAKYFIHYCNAVKGDQWSRRHIQHFCSQRGGSA